MYNHKNAAERGFKLNLYSLRDSHGTVWKICHKFSSVTVRVAA